MLNFEPQSFRIRWTVRRLSPRKLVGGNFVFSGKSCSRFFAVKEFLSSRTTSDRYPSLTRIGGPDSESGRLPALRPCNRPKKYVLSSCRLALRKKCLKRAIRFTWNPSRIFSAPAATAAQSSITAPARRAKSWSVPSASKRASCLNLCRSTRRNPKICRKFGPVAPPRLCPACGANMAPYGSTCSTCESNRRRTFGLVVGLVSAVVVLAVGWLFLKRFYTTSVPLHTAPPANTVLSQPRVKTPKSLTDFKVGKFSLEQKRGSDLVVAVGDLQNTSANVYQHLRLYVDLLDAHGVKVETVSSEVAELLPDKTWHFIYTVRNPQAKTARFATVKEMQ